VENKIIVNNKTKTVLKDLIKEVLHEEYIHEMRSEIYRFIESVGKQVVIDELKNIVPEKIIVDRMEKLMQQNMTPIIKKAINLSIKRFNTKVRDQLSSIINLKTSTIMEIKSTISDPKTEEDVLEELSINFPEYYNKISIEYKGEIKNE